MCTLLLCCFILLFQSNAWLHPFRSYRDASCRYQTSEDPSSSGKKEAITSVDVSDLGITMDQLYEPLNDDMDIESRGSSKHFSWREQADAVYVTMKHEGMRGQPSGAIDVQFTDTTVTVTIFGYVVWSGILAGAADAAICEYEAKDEMENNIPLITMKITKRLDIVNGDANRWNNFITGLGQDSILD